MLVLVQLFVTLVDAWFGGVISEALLFPSSYSAVEDDVLKVL